MHTEVVSATNALEGFATELDGTWTDQPFHTQIGSWNIVPLSRADLSSRVRRLGERLSALSDDEINEDLMRKIRGLPEQLSWFQSQTLPQLSSGNLPQVIASFDSIVSNLEQSLPVRIVPDWDEVAKSDLVPRALARRIRALEATVNSLSPRTVGLEEKIELIEGAHAAALDLPTDLQALKEARDAVSAYAATCERAASDSSHELDVVKGLRSMIETENAAASKLISNIESAYSAATTAGLAASFTERASILTRSTWIWVALLMSALAIGGLVGAHRLADLKAIAALPSVTPSMVWLNAGMSLLAIAAPVWFAWIATRQISQRFRLAEDYAFKASVARAYEGYRREAARLDPALEARLFASALDRLDEAPLRFLALEEHGSPYEALLASTGFQKALEKFPNLREATAEVLDRVGGRQAQRDQLKATVQAASPDQ